MRGRGFGGLRAADWSRRNGWGELSEDISIDEWGVGYMRGSDAAYHMTRMLHPLQNAESLEEIVQYPFPSTATAETGHMRAQVEAIQARGYAALGNAPCTVWETSWYIRSMEQLMMDMMTDDEKAVNLIDRVTDIACLKAAAFARAGVDILELGDDVGTQSSLMMSRETYCKWLKPRLARAITAARAQKPDIIVSYHSCGYVLPLIGDFIEAGIDVLNPVQPESMSFEAVHREFGDRLSFWGTLGTQTTMPFGTPDDVRDMVFRNLDIAGPSGGLLCAPTHTLEPEVPLQNLEAYVRACREYRP